MIADPVAPADERRQPRRSLRTFMRLPVAQRCSIILMDVLGYSLDEIGGVTGTSIPAIKAALHRGRARLRELAQEPDDRAAAALDEAERALLAAYVDRFNARDFDAVRDMLADEVRLELVNKSAAQRPKRRRAYFTNYSTDRRLALRARLRRPPPGVAGARSGRPGRHARLFRPVGLVRRTRHDHSRFPPRALRRGGMPISSR